MGLTIEKLNAYSNAHRERIKKNEQDTKEAFEGIDLTELQKIGQEIKEKAQEVIDRLENRNTKDTSSIGTKIIGKAIGMLPYVHNYVKKVHDEVKTVTEKVTTPSSMIENIFRLFGNKVEEFRHYEIQVSNLQHTFKEDLKFYEELYTNLKKDLEDTENDMEKGDINAVYDQGIRLRRTILSDITDHKVQITNKLPMTYTVIRGILNVLENELPALRKRIATDYNLVTILQDLQKTQESLTMTINIGLDIQEKTDETVKQIVEHTFKSRMDDKTTKRAIECMEKQEDLGRRMLVIKEEMRKKELEDITELTKLNTRLNSVVLLENSQQQKLLK